RRARHHEAIAEGSDPVLPVGDVLHAGVEAHRRVAEAGRVARGQVEGVPGGQLDLVAGVAPLGARVVHPAAQPESLDRGLPVQPEAYAPVGRAIRVEPGVALLRLDVGDSTQQGDV